MIKFELNSDQTGGYPSKNTIVPPWRDIQCHGKPSDIFAKIIPEQHRDVKG
jgi:hypothetical protein